MLFVGACEQDPNGQPVNPFEGMTSVAVAPRLEEPPKWMTSGCPSLAKLRESELPQEEAESEWGADAQLYENCRVKHAALRNFYRKRDAALRTAKTQ